MSRWFVFYCNALHYDACIALPYLHYIVLHCVTFPLVGEWKCHLHLEQSEDGNLCTHLPLTLKWLLRLEKWLIKQNFWIVKHCHPGKLPISSGYYIYLLLFQLFTANMSASSEWTASTSEVSMTTSPSLSMPLSQQSYSILQTHSIQPTNHSSQGPLLSTAIPGMWNIRSY